jgi:hypothetical protein
MLLKGVAGIAILLIAIVIAGLSGLNFRLWPTDLVDHRLSVAPDVIQRLRDLQAERKFGPDMATFYPGAPDESRRRMAVRLSLRLDEQVSVHPNNPCRNQRGPFSSLPIRSRYTQYSV